MIDVDEPFAGLFTQGMVTHETYEIEVPSKIVDGIKRQPVNRTQFLSPSEIERRDGKVFAIGSNLEVKIGRVEKMRSEEHTSELQSLMRNSYAVFCLKKKKEVNQ